jgi:peptidoglycan hydrolase-like protein with peptidoglycan-binding domain
MTTHAVARSLAHDALVRRFATDPQDGAVKALAGVGFLETAYGDGWKGSGAGSNNIGACQAGSGWHGDVFSYVDTHPTSTGGSVPYRVDFRKYPSPAAGWLDLVEVEYVNRGRAGVLAAANENDFHRVSELLYATGYYEGWGASKAERIEHHFQALSRAIRTADAAAGLVVVAQPRPLLSIPPTVRRGDGRWNDRQDVVRLLQRELRDCAADGEFGPITAQCVCAYQKAHGLVVEPVVGVQTWTCLLTDSYVPGEIAA